MRVKSDAKKAAIIEVATELFLADGYARTSMARIASALGGSKATLYNYFPRKEDVFTAMMATISERVGFKIFETEPVDGDVRAVLVRSARSYIAFTTSPYVLAINRLVVADAGRFPEIGRIFFENGPNKGIARLTGLFQHFMDLGLLRTADAQIAALHFKALCDSSVMSLHLWNITETTWPRDLDQVAPAAVDAFLGGYGTSKTA